MRFEVSSKTYYTPQENGHSRNLNLYYHINYKGTYGSNTFEVFNTWNCQMTVIAGIENAMAVAEMSDGDFKESLTKMFRKVFEVTSKPLMLVDVNNSCKEKLKNFFARYFYSGTSFTSTNLNERNILILRIDKL